MSGLFHRWPRRVAALVAAAALALAGLTAALLTAFGGPATPLAVPSTVYTGAGFDPCAAPSSATMDAWLQSPYRGIGIYLGGLRYATGCRSQNTANLTSEWVGRQAAKGWRFLPLYVGSQATYTNGSGTQLSDFDALNGSTAAAYALGTSEADDAATLAKNLAFPSASVIYNDMESYKAQYTPLVIAYSQGWTAELHRNGFRSGWYSSSGSGIKDQVAAYGPASPDVLDIANWNQVNSTADPNVPASEWANHQRVHQTQGGHNETWGGVTINIDSDWFDVGTANRATVERIAGADRDTTAVDASLRTFDCAGCSTAGRDPAKAAVLSRDDTYADALGGSALAAQAGGPLLLTPPSGMNPTTMRELHRILPSGSTVYLLGGTSALSPAVEAAVTANGFNAQRISGGDRFETAVNIAKTISPAGAPSNVLVATGVDFPDALAAGAAAGAVGIQAEAQGSNGAVVVLTNGAQMPAETQAYLAGIDPQATQVYGVGGKAVTAFQSADPAWSFTQLSGYDRYDTAVRVATQFFHQPTSTVVASGMNWPDALSGGAMAAHRDAPLLLTDPHTLAGATGWYLGGKNNPITTATVVGGPAAITPASLTALGNAFSYPGQWDLVNFP